MLIRVCYLRMEGIVGDVGLQVNTGDSNSWTSLSIWINMLTVISSSALGALVVMSGLDDGLTYKTWRRL